MNAVVIDEFLKILELIPSESTHAKQIMIPFDATHPIIIPLKIFGVTTYSDVRNPTKEE